MEVLGGGAGLEGMGLNGSSNGLEVVVVVVVGRMEDFFFIVLGGGRGRLRRRAAGTKAILVTGVGGGGGAVLEGDAAAEGASVGVLVVVFASLFDGSDWTVSSFGMEGVRGVVVVVVGVGVEEEALADGRFPKRPIFFLFPRF